MFFELFSLANNRTFLQRDTDRMRTWFPLFSYFEENVKTAIPNEYCLPGFISELRAMMTNWTETIKYSAYWVILFLFIVITYSCSFSKKMSLSSIIER